MGSTNSSGLLIRKAGLEDAAPLTGLCFQLGYSAVREEVSARLKSLLTDEEHVIFVAEYAGAQVAGWLHAYIYKPFHCDFMTEIAGLVVDKDFRGQGAGRQLMLAAEGWAKGKGCTVVSLRSNIIRKEAHSFYKKLGYDIIKESYTFRKEI